MAKLPERISVIQLRGDPYQRYIGEELIDCNRGLDTLAHAAGYSQSLPAKIRAVEEQLRPLFDGGYQLIGKQLARGNDLDFSNAFSLVTFVSAAVNRSLKRAVGRRIPGVGTQETHLMQSVALLASMSAKGAYANFTAHEIAGMVAAAIHLDTVVRTPSSEPVVAFGGMGGDRGYPLEGGNSKLFSLSTLAALALSVTGKVHKHHSYPNTSKVAGQSAIEAWGARSDFNTPQAFEDVLQDSDLLMSSCHNTRTLHTVSHRLKSKTINHLVGPLAFTMDSDTKLIPQIGVNDQVHPQTVAEALSLLRAKGFQDYGNGAVYCGTDTTRCTPEMLDPALYYASMSARERVRLDEIAPPPYISLVAFTVAGLSVGTFYVAPEDFYRKSELKHLSFDDLLIPNSAPSILRYNLLALNGRDHAKARYLAMTIGMAIFTRDYLHLPDALDVSRHRVNAAYLRAATTEGLAILRSGQAAEQLDKYVKATKKYAGMQGVKYEPAVG